MSCVIIRNQILLLIIWILAAQSTLFGQEQVTGFLTDPRDGKTYKTVNIGGRWWMAENLDYETPAGSWRVDNNTDSSRQGRFYNWEAAKTASPPGWHLPTKQEFQNMLDSIGTTRKEWYQKLVRGGETGFDAILLGSHMEKYGKQGTSAHFWSSSLWWFSSWFRLTENPWRLCLRKEDYVNIGHFATSEVGFNVRCIKDE